jgi:hypothetical protein
MATSPTLSKPKHVRDLLLLFSVPSAIALLAAIAIFVPRLAAHPSYNFIYSDCRTYSCDGTYTVGSNGRLEFDPSDFRMNTVGSPVSPPQLRYFDVRTNSSRPLALSDAQDLKLDSVSRSPDGYVLKHVTGGSDMLFVSNYTDTWQLENGFRKRPVAIDTTSTYENNISFIGWVTQ